MGVADIMWRLVLVSFAFLGVAFYEASGGSDYAPAANSLQVAMRDKPFFAPPREKIAPSAVAAADIAPQPEITAKPEPRVTKTPNRTLDARTPTTFAGLSGITKDELGGFGITLASASQPLNGGDAIAARPLAGIGGFNAETLVSDVQDIPIDQAVVSTRGLADIRSITGESANMRSGPGTDFETVDQLTRGTDVEILGQRGAWVELRDLNTGQTGWMADWLVTAAN
jgi:hypothetical protein